MFRIEDRIHEIAHLLAAGSVTRAGSGEAGALGEGSIVTLRFPDGDEESFYASSILDTAPGDTPIGLLGLDSPMAKALAGCSAGDRISWRTPTRSHEADVVAIQSR